MLGCHYYIQDMFTVRAKDIIAALHMLPYEIKGLCMKCLWDHVFTYLPFEYITRPSRLYLESKSVEYFSLTI